MTGLFAKKECCAAWRLAETAWSKQAWASALAIMTWMDIWTSSRHILRTTPTSFITTTERGSSRTLRGHRVWEWKRATFVGEQELSTLTTMVFRTSLWSRATCILRSNERFPNTPTKPRARSSETWAKACSKSLFRRLAQVWLRRIAAEVAPSGTLITTVTSTYWSSISTSRPRYYAMTSPGRPTGSK